MKGNVLVLRALSKGSKWCDKDHVMLYACFQLLVDFLEKERPQAFVDFKHDVKQRNRWKEFKALYRYWKHVRPRMERNKRALLMKWGKSRKTKMVPGHFKNTVQEVEISADRKTWNLLRKAEDKFEKQEEEMLNRLIAIRRHLWC